MNEDIVIPIAGMITGVIMLLGFPLAIVYARKLWMKDSQANVQHSPVTDHRLERIEQAIDAMAVEVERVAESQRFMTKLLSERAKDPIGIAASQSRHEG